MMNLFNNHIKMEKPKYKIGDVVVFNDIAPPAQMLISRAEWDGHWCYYSEVDIGKWGIMEGDILYKL